MVALCQAPFLLDDPNVGLVFPADTIARAKHYLSLTSGGLGIFFEDEFISFVICNFAYYVCAYILVSGRREGRGLGLCEVRRVLITNLAGSGQSWFF